MATTTIFPFATQGAWWIPTETVCSFQAATLPTLSAILSGDGFDEETKRVAVSSTSSLIARGIEFFHSAPYPASILH